MTGSGSPVAGRRVLFFGTPGFALPSLEALWGAGALLEVVTRPPRPAGRGHRVAESPVARAAQGMGIAVHTPERLGDGALVARLRAFGPDFVVTVAYGRILPSWLLELPRVAAVNLHPSPLPALRGPAPIVRALLAGMTTTAVAVIHMAATADTGDIIAMEPAPILPRDDLGQLTDRLARQGAGLLVRSLADLALGRAARRPQAGEASWAPVLAERERWLDFTRSAVELERTVRALAPAPGALLTVAGHRLKVLAASPEEGAGPAGVILGDRGGALRVACGEGVLALARVVPAGRPAMDGAAFLRGHPDLPGARCLVP